MNNNELFNSTQQPIPAKKNKKKRATIFVFILLFVLVAIIAGGFYLWKHQSKPQSMPEIYFVVAPTLNIVEKKSDDSFSVIDKTSYGTQFLLQYPAITFKNKKYLRILPFSTEDESTRQKFEKNSYYLEVINDYDIAFEEDYDAFYKKYYAQKTTQNFASHIKKILAEYLKSNNHFNFTQNPDKLKSSIAYGDFDMDEENDIAVVLESDNESALLILCYNPNTKESYIAENKIIEGKPIINVFKKGTAINMGTLTNAPNTGVMLNYPTAPELKKAILYNPETKQFEEHIQNIIKEDIISAEFEITDN